VCQETDQAEMKIKRYKRAQRLLGFYRHNFGFQIPFRILLDGTFCQAALDNKINLMEQMPKYLNCPVELCTTGCVLKELEALGTRFYGALHICRQFDVDPCPHRPSRSAAECLAHLARRMAKPERRKYFIATQDNKLTDALRQIPGVPVLFIKYSGILLDKPSESSVQMAEASKSDLTTVQKLKTEILGDASESRKRKRKGPSGPNPLSCKKKQSKNNTVDQRTVMNNSTLDNEKKKTRRRRKKPIETQNVA